MTKLEILNDKINLFKIALSLELGISVADITLDVTCDKLPDYQMDNLKETGLIIKIVDSGMAVTKSTFFEENGTIIHFYGKRKSSFMDEIYDICKPKMLTQSKNI